MTDPSVIRVATWNLWGATEPLEERLSRLCRALLAVRPDVVCLQEVAALPGGQTTADLLASSLEMQCVGEGALAVLSRNDIALVRGIDRHVPALSVEVSHAGVVLTVHCLHLAHELAGGLERERQVLALADRGRRCRDSLQVFAGDFNADPDSDEMRFLRGLTTLGGKRTYFQDAWAHCHPGTAGPTWCAQPAKERRFRSVDVDRRIDYVMVSAREKSGVGTVLACERLGEMPAPPGGVLSDHLGVYADVRVLGS